MTTEVELTLGEIMDKEFSAAVNIMATTELPMKTSYWFSKIAKKLIQEQKNYHTVRIERLKKYAMLDEKGEIIPQEINEDKDKEKAKFENDEKSAAFDKELAELKSQKIKVQTMPLSYLMDDETLKLTPGVLAHLDKIIVDRPVNP